MERADLSDDIEEESKYAFASLCKVEGLNHFRNGLQLRRITDISDGTILAQYASTFPSREILYDNHRMDFGKGFVGVWNWSLEFNPNSGRKDYVQSLFYKCPAEILMLTGCKTLDDIKNKLLEGVACSPCGNKMLFSCTIDVGRYIGMLCKEDDVDNMDGRVTLKPNVFDLPAFEFSEQEIVRIADIAFYFKVSVGVPRQRFPVKDPMEIVRQKVLEFANKSVMRIHGFSNSERQRFHEFLSILPTTDFDTIIAHACGCSETVAKQYVHSFAQAADKYLNPNELGDDVLAEIVSHSADMLLRCKGLLEEDWRKENSEKIDSMKATIKTLNEKLDSINSEIAAKEARSALLDSEYDKTLSIKAAIDTEIEQREQRVEEIEEALSLRMNKAKKNVSEFAAEIISIMPFLGQVPSQSSTNSTLSSSSTTFYSGKELSSDYAEELSNWRDLLDTLQDNLLSAGVSQKNDFSETVSWAFASFLYSAFLNHNNLLIAGPLGHEIADAFSCARYGKKAAILDCSMPYSSGILDVCSLSDEKVIVVLNPLSATWVGHISEISAFSEKFIIAVQPFAEVG